MKYPLRTVIPILLLLGTTLLAVYLHQLEIERRIQVIETNAVEELKRIATSAIKSSNQLYALHPELINKLFPSLGSDSGISELMMFDRDGVITASLYEEDYNHPVEEIINGENSVEWAAIDRIRNTVLSTHQSERYFSSDRDFVYALYPVFLPVTADGDAASAATSPAAMLYIKKDLRRIKAQGHREVDRQVLESSVYFAVMALLLWVFSHFFVSNRVAKLVMTTGLFSQGKLNVRAGLRGGDELATISKAFDDMAGKLGNTMANLRDSEETTRLLLDSTAEGIVAIDLNGDCIMTNPACLQLLGYHDLNEVIGKNMHDLAHHTYPDGRHYHAADCPIRQTLTRGLTVHNDREYFWRKDGSWIHAEYWSHPIRKQRRVIGAVITFLDITERKKAQNTLEQYQIQLEELVEERTKELTVVNEELRAFSYSVSHDLRAPLRSIRGFSRALEEEYSGRLGSNGLDYLHRIQAAAGRMNELIRDLLTLSQVTRSVMSLSDVDMSRQAEEIIQGLMLLHPSRRITIDIADGLIAEGDERLLRILLENLLNNAWKFSSKKQQAMIKFDKAPGDGFDTYFIRDNGSGFDMNYADKLFTPFNRLHTNDEFEGTGIGLATVQRIIHRHGGEVWAEGKPGQGATVYFTLKPVRHQEPATARLASVDGAGQHR